MEVRNRCYESLHWGHSLVWSERLERASLRKSHWNGDLKDEKLILCKGLMSGRNITSLRDRKWPGHRFQEDCATV